MKNLVTAQIYVGTYRKYNDGSLFGKWLQLSDYDDKDEFLHACAELHKDEQDPEFMFQDWEYIPESIISESWISEKVFDIISELYSLDNLDALSAFIDAFGFNLDKDDINDIISKFNDAYNGEYSSEEDFAYGLVNDCYNLDDPFASYFDYEKFARDLFMCDYTYNDGYVFNSNF